jgi:branched-subunit amino acid transport protein
MAGMVVTILWCAVGTFLLRWLPLRQVRRQARSDSTGEALQRSLAGIGPAAIAALWVVSTVGLADVEGASAQTVRIAAALGGTAAVRRLCRSGVALPTLCGAVVYGALGSPFG